MHRTKSHITRRHVHVFGLFSVAFVMAAYASAYAYLGETPLALLTATVSLLFSASLFQSARTD